LDYREVPPELQRIRGPYPLAAGVTAYVKHADRHSHADGHSSARPPVCAVVRDTGTTVSGVQSAIALEALVSAAFILIGSKVGDLIGRKLAYVLGLLGYAVGALAMAFAQSLTAIIVFWAVVGGLGAPLLLPAMQSLIHGNFEGAAQKKAYALVGAPRWRSCRRPARPWSPAWPATPPRR
jgi:MFS family permease